MPGEITRASPDSAGACALIAELDAHLESLYPAESRHGYSVEKLLREEVAFFVIHHDGLPAGCGGVQVVGAEYAELKRMYVRPSCRGRGLGKQLLAHLSMYARSQGMRLLRLETGLYQVEAMGLYEQAGFVCIPPFGVYHNAPLSRFYEKELV